MTDTTHAGRNGGVYLVSAARTPIGKFGGALADVPAVELGGVAIRAAVERSGLPADTPVDEVLMGQVLQAGAGQAPARQAALRGGLPVTTSATTINRVCGSGLKAIMLGAAEIRAGDAEVVVAGGMESMNGAPYLLPRARFGYRLGDGTLVDATVHDGLWCAIEGCHMWHPRRAVGDLQQGQPRGPGRVRAAQPPERDRGDRRRAGSRPSSPRSPSATPRAARRSSAVDEGPRRDSTIEALARLKPAFDLPEGEDRGNATSGTATAGNAPGITDGAAATVVASERTVERYGLKPLARIVGYAQAEVEPKWLFLAPGPWASAGSSIGSRCRSRRSTSIEINEAFAAQTLADGRRARLRLGQGERERRGDRPRSPGRRVRSPDRRDPPPRARSGERAATASQPCASAAAGRWRWPSSGSDRQCEGGAAPSVGPVEPRADRNGAPIRISRPARTGRSPATTSRDRRPPRSPRPE